MKKIILPIAILLFGQPALCQNPQLLKDVYPGSTGSGIQEIVKTSNYTFFNADDDDADTDRGLYRTDGTTAGTIKLILTYPSYISTKAEKLTALGNKIIFAGDNLNFYGELWVSDGSQAGTIALERFQPSTYSTRTSRRIVMDIARLNTDALYGVKATDNHLQLKKTDGTPGGMTILKDFGIFTSVEASLALFRVINGILYFNLFDGNLTDQLWRSDGTAAGTYLVKDYGVDKFVASGYMQAGSLFYTMLVMPGTGNVLWKSDGTEAGTSAVKTIGTTGNNNYPQHTAIGSTLYFAGLDGNGSELWKTDGTAAGTVMVADINPGAAGSNPANLTALNGNIYFTASDASGSKLWKYDGSTLSIIKDGISVPFSGNGSSTFAASGNTILFNGSTAAGGAELWITDGTAANTRQISDINPGAANSTPLFITPGNPVFFSASNGTTGAEIYKYDNSAGIAGLNKIYVNDNSTANDLLTTAIGNDGNNGTKSAPFATINHAISLAQPGDTILVDAGTYAEQVFIDKGITLRGAGSNLTSISLPADAIILYAPGFEEYGVIQSTQNIADVTIKDLAVNGNNFRSDNQPANGILLQTHGEVSGCEISNTNIGVFMRDANHSRTMLVVNNYLHDNIIGINCLGQANTVIISNNKITVAANGPSFKAIMAGLDFGPAQQLTVFGNEIVNYSGAFLAGSINSLVTQNSMTGIRGLYYQQNGGSPVSFTCNWFGTTDAEIIKSKNSGSINYAPWLTSGVDGNTATVGFQPASGSCVGRQNKFYVNDSYTSGVDVFTTAAGNNSNNGFSTAPFATINHAISMAQAGDTIIVDAGLYAERIIVNKKLYFKGAYSGVNPGSLLSRGLSETILLPSIENNLLEIITVESSNVSFDGFLFNGDNPAITGSISLNGFDVNAGMGIYNNNIQADSMVIKNNIFKNFHRYGIFLQKNTSALTGINISQNHIDNISSRAPRDGRAVGLFNNAYATVTNNHLTRVNTGVIIANFNVGSTDSVFIGSNTIEAYSFGVNSSGHSNLTSSFTVDNNQITVADLIAWSAPGASPVNNSTAISMGVIVSTRNLSVTNNSISGTINGINISRFTSTGQLALTNNLVTGTQTGVQLSSINTTQPVLVNGGSISNSLQLGLFYIGNGTTTDRLKVNNVSLVNNVVGIDVSATGGKLQMEFEGTSIDGGTTGIRFYGKELSLPDNSFTGVSFSNQAKEYILQTSKSFQGQTIDASNAIFDGSTPIQMTLAQLFATEDKLTHRIDFDSVGYFKLKPSQVFVTKNSFAATLPPVFGTPTFTAQINRAIHAAAPGDIIHVGEGNYSNQVIIDKAVTLKGAGMGLTTIQMPQLPHIAAFTAPDYGSEYGVVQTTENITGDVIIEQVTVDGVNQTFLNNAHGIIIQTSGKISNCEVKNMRNPILNQTYQTGNGIFARYNGTAPKSITFEGNKISGFHYNGLLAFGSAFLVDIKNNEVDGTGGQYSMGINTSGVGGGVQSLNISNNAISGFTGFGIGVSGNTLAVIHNNAITGTGNLAINNPGTAPFNATCNWFGATDLETISSKINGLINFSPWLTNGTDTDIATGFQPVPNSCNGVPVDADIALAKNVSCNGASDGSIDVVIEDGVAPFNYEWSKDDVAGFSTSENLENLSPGLYKLIVTDANGSVDSVFTDISEPGVLTAVASGSNNSCFGASEGSAEVLPSGGTAPYSYVWSNGSTSDHISNLVAGLYSVTVTDANGCTSVASYEVTQPTLLSVSASGVSTSCSNSATATAAGGVAPYTYNWSNAATTAGISFIPAGTYTVSVTDANGCMAVANVTVTGGEGFNPSVQATNVNCFGANDGTITISNVNGTAPFQYSIDGINFFPTNVFTGVAPGTYTIAVKDAAGCAGFVTKIISEPTPIAVTLNTVQNTCAGGHSGSISVSVAGGTPAYKYSWTGPGSFTSAQLTISNLAEGNYTLTVTDKNNCAAILHVTVNAFPAISVSDIVANVDCRGSNTGTIDLTVSGGTESGFTYSWTGARVSALEDLTNLAAAANYNVRITDNGSGCFVSKTYTITQPLTSLSVTAVKTNAAGCEGGLGTITATGSGGTSPYQYKLDDGAYQASGLFTGLYGGNYTLWVKDKNGCTVSKLITITDNGSDQFESNNSKSQAKQIPIGSTSYARLALANDAADWFKITTPPGTASYTVSLGHPDFLYTFNLYAAGNNTPALNAASSGSGYKTYTLAGNTTYYISITGGSLSFKCYGLSVTTPSMVNTNQLTANKRVAVEENEISELKTSVFPNPHQGNFSMKVTSPEKGKARIELFTANGQLLTEKMVPLSKGENIIPFTKMPLGILIYKLTIGSRQTNGKIAGIQ